MEKLDKNQTKDYRPLEIWAGDLIDIFTELKDCSDLKLIADDVKYESVDEFVNESKGRKPTKLTISARAPSLSLELGRNSAYLYVSSSKQLASGLFHNIDSILSRCERKPRFFYRYIWAIGCSLILPYIFKLTPLIPYSYLSDYGAALIFSWIIYVGYINYWRFSVVHPMYRHEKSNFFRKNIDAIIIAIISAILGASATKVADRFWPNTTSPIVEREVPQTNSH